MSLFYGETKESLANRQNFLDGLGINYQDLVCAKQVHSSSVRYAKEEDKGCGALSYDTSILNTDALVTDKRNLPLAIFTADCLSIFVYDAKAHTIGLIHAGWRSTKENITLKTMQFIKQQFNTDMSGFYVSFGPGIRGCCYMVDENFNDFFPQDLEKRGGHYYLDLARINKKQLLESEVKEANIFDPQICTFCRNDEFFSYRREGKACGRIMSVIMLK
jgi:hypothetical protein